MTKSKTKQVSSREVKSSAFTAYFSKPENAAKLYAALENEDISPDDVQITTLEGVLFVARKNDLSFTVKNRVLVISEHQSTINFNMPLRSVIYYGRTLEKLLASQSLYIKKLIPIPTPEFFVFYNGNEPFPSEKILHLPDSYLEKAPSPMLELNVKIININLLVNHDILTKCHPLYEYSWFIQQIKTHMAEGMERDAAITTAIEDCEQNDIFTDFTREHGTEVRNMLYTQFNLEDAQKVWKKEAHLDGIADSIIELLSELEPVSFDLKWRIQYEGDEATLKKWLKIAAKAESLQDFYDKADL